MAGRGLTRRSQVLEDDKDAPDANADIIVPTWVTESKQLEPDLAIDDVPMGYDYLQDAIAEIPGMGVQRHMEDKLTEAVKRMSISAPKTAEKDIVQRDVVLTEKIPGEDTTHCIYSSLRNFHPSLQHYLFSYEACWKLFPCIQAQVNIPMHCRPVYSSLASFLCNMKLMGSVGDRFVSFCHNGVNYMKIRMKFNNFTEETQKTVEQDLLKHESVVQSEEEAGRVLGDCLFCTVELQILSDKNASASSAFSVVGVEAAYETYGFKVVIRSAIMTTPI